MKYDAMDLYLSGTYHEAGHAVAYMANGLDFDRIDMDANGGAGEVILREARQVDRRVLALVAAAGPAAELRYRGEPPMTGTRMWAIISGTDPFYGTQDGHSDFETFLVSCTTPDAEWRDAERFVADHWEAIGAVADALVEAAGRLDYATAAGIVKEFGIRRRRLWVPGVPRRCAAAREGR